MTEPFNFELVQIELGTDEDGDPINSCAVGGITAAVQRQDGPRLTKNQQTMLGLLDDFGPGGATVEDSIQVVKPRSVQNVIGRQKFLRGAAAYRRRTK